MKTTVSITAGIIHVLQPIQCHDIIITNADMYKAA